MQYFTGMPQQISAEQIAANNKAWDLKMAKLNEAKRLREEKAAYDKNNPSIWNQAATAVSNLGSTQTDRGPTPSIWWSAANPFTEHYSDKDFSGSKGSFNSGQDPTSLANRADNGELLNQQQLDILDSNFVYQGRQY